MRVRAMRGAHNRYSICSRFTDLLPIARRLDPTSSGKSRHTGTSKHAAIHGSLSALRDCTGVPLAVDLLSHPDAVHRSPLR